jgi:hypothetical protein
MADNFGRSLSENLITVLCHDDANGKIVAGMADPLLFEGDYRIVAERAIAYWRKQNRAPGVHTSDLFADILDDPKNKRRATFQRILRNMHQLSEGMNTQYVLQVLRDHTRVAQLKDGIFKAAEQLEQHEQLAIGDVEEIINELLRVREIGFEPGLRLRDVDKVFDFLESQQSEFVTGIRELDRRHIVPARGQVQLWLAPTGRGKSWALGHVGKHALLQRKRVLHVSLEMRGEEVAQRYYQSLFSIPKHPGKIKISTFDQDDETGKIEAYDYDTVKPVFSLDDRAARRRVKKLVAGFNKEKLLVIKKFPMRSLTVNQLDAYLDTLEATENFIPDMLILDYIGVMKTDARDHRISLGRTFEDFHGLIERRNMAGVTAAQVSRAGAEAAFVKSTHVSEDWSLIHTTDTAVTYTATDDEESLGLARLFVAKGRQEKDKFGLVITQSYAMGQFCLQSAPLVADYYKHVENEAPESLHKGKRSKRRGGLVDDDDEGEDD